MNKGIRRLLYPLITVIILLSLIAPALPVSAETSTVNLVLEPAVKAVNAGETFTVIVQAQCGTQPVNGIEIFLDFDTTYLTVQSASAGTDLPTILKKPTYDNATGTFWFAAGVLEDTIPSGTFTVVTITFLAKNPTTVPTQIVFSTAWPRITEVSSISSDTITGTLTGGSYTIQDTSPPVVASISPTSGQTAVAVNAPVILTFSKAMNQAATETAFSLSPPVSGTFGWNELGNIMTFTPSAGLAYSTAYTVNLSTEAKSTNDIPMASPFSSSFTTEKALTSIAVTPAGPAVPKGLTQQFTATGNYTDGSTGDITSQVTWNSSDDTKVTINASGLAKAENITASPVTITASSGAVQGTASMSVTPAELTAITVNPATASKAKGLTQQFTATGTYTDSSTDDLTGQVAWASLDISKVTINANGLAKAEDVTSEAVTITATKGAVQGTAAMSVTKAELTGITVDPSTASRPKGLTQQFTATGTYTDGSTDDITNQVTWDSSDDTKVTIDASGLAKAENITTSPVTITATYFSGFGFLAVNAANSTNIQGTAIMSVTPAELTGITINPAAASQPKGSTQQFTATGIYTDDSTGDITNQVTWTSSDNSKVTIDAGGLATAEAITVSPVTITATLNSIQGTASMSVTKAGLTGITIDPASVSKAKGLSQQFTATGTYTDSSTSDLTSQVTWVSSDITKVTIDAGGLAEAENVTTSPVTITASSGSIHGTASMSVTPAELTGITVTPDTTSKAKGLTQQFTATGTYTDGSTSVITNQVTWASSDIDKVTIDNTGLANALAVTETPVTITAASGTIQGTASMGVTPAELTGITIDPASVFKAKGLTQQFTATGTYTDKTEIDLTGSATWASSDTQKVTISDSGLAEAKDITDEPVDITAAYGGRQGTATMSVTPAEITSIAVDPATASRPKGLTQQFTAYGTYTDNSVANITGSVTWTSSDESKVTIDAGGLARAENITTSPVTITASYFSGFGFLAVNAANSTNIQGTAAMSVTPAELTGITVDPQTVTKAKGLTQQFSATGTYTDGSTIDLTSQVTWTSSDDTKVNIDAGGLATALAVTETPVTITATFTEFQGTASMSVTPAELTGITVDPAIASQPKGSTQQFTATGIYTDGSTKNITSEVTWTSSDNSTVTIDAGGLATAEAITVLPVTITASSGAVQGAASMSVTKAGLTGITIDPASVSKAKGLTQQFTATGTYTDGSTSVITNQVTWASSDIDKVTIDNTGLANALAVTETPVTITAASGAIQGTASMSVTPAELTGITVTPDTTSKAKGLTQQFTAIGIYTDETGIDLTGSATWASSDTQKVTISDSGLAEAKEVTDAPVTITATYLDRQGTASMNVTPAELTGIAVDPTTASRPKGLTQHFTAYGTYTDNSVVNITNSVTWTSSDIDKVTIDASGLAKAENVTTSPVTITAASGAVQGTASMSVTPAELTGITVDPQTVTKAKGLTQQFSATGTYTDGSTIDLTGQVTWNSSDDTKVNIDAGGLATALAVTETPVTITATFTEFQSTASMSVTPAELTGITVDPKTVTKAKGLTQQFTATGFYTDNTSGNLTETVIWTSSDNSKVTIDASGLAKAENITTSPVTITATWIPDTGPLLFLTANSTILEGTAEMSVTPAELTSITVDPAVASQPKGRTQQFTATGNYTDDTTANITDSVTWASSDDSKVSINDNGLAEAKDVTETPVSITATSGDFTATATMEVTAPVIDIITITPAALNILKNETYQLTATGKYSDNSTGNVTGLVEWFSTDESKVSFDSPGLARGKDITAAPVLVKATSGNATEGTAFITVSNAALTGIEVKPASVSMYVNQTFLFSVIPTYDDNSHSPVPAVAWSSNDTSKVSIDSTGLAKALAITTAPVIITATSGNYTSNATVNVVSASGNVSGEGGGSPSTVTVLTGFTASNPLNLNYYGVLQEAVKLQTKDGKLTLDIAGGTKLLSTSNSPLTSLSAAATGTPPAPPSGAAVVLCYTLGPEGAKFDPPLTLTLTYDQASLPAGVAEKDLYIAYYDGTQWQTLVGTVDTVANTITVKISHFSLYAVLGKITPAQTPSASPQPTQSTTPATTTAAVTTLATTPAVKPTTTPPSTTPAATATTPAVTSTVPAVTTTALQTTPPGDGSTNWTPIIIVIVVVVVVIILVVALILRKRRGADGKS